LIETLKMLRSPTPPVPEAVATRRGYKIKRSHPDLSPGERLQREEATIRAIAEAMRRGTDLVRG
jgi:hypothetical protein